MAGLEFLGLHPFVRQETEDRVLGTIVGSALGDCIGLYTEFLPKSDCIAAYPSGKFSLLKTVPLRGDSHRDRFNAGEWTDDTDHALLLLLSYLHDKNTPLLEQFPPRLRSWCSQGLRCLDRLPLGLGRTVSSSHSSVHLRQLTAQVALAPDFLANPRGAATTSWKRAPHDRKPAANGSLMRTHPLGVICVPLTLDQTFLLAARLSTVTHADPRCVVACCATTALLRGLLRGEVAAEVDVDALCMLARDFVLATPEFANPGGEEAFSDADAQALLRVDELDRYLTVGTLEELKLDDAMAMGYVYKCLGAAVLTLRRGMRRSRREAAGGALFEGLTTELVMQGGDADTNACVAGALLGAWAGFSRLPRDWVEGMRNGQWLVGKAYRLSQHVGISPLEEGVPFLAADPDTLPDGGKGELNRDELEKREAALVTSMLGKMKERKEQEERKAKKGLGKLFSF